MSGKIVELAVIRAGRRARKMLDAGFDQAIEREAAVQSWRTLEDELSLSIGLDHRSRARSAERAARPYERGFLLGFACGGAAAAGALLALAAVL